MRRCCLIHLKNKSTGLKAYLSMKFAAYSEKGVLRIRFAKYGFLTLPWSKRFKL